jgi:hypothetical protein
MPYYVWPILFAALVSGLTAFCVGITNRVRQLELSMRESDTKMSPLWARVQAELSSDLHHDDPKYKEADCLIEELAALTITPKGRRRLKELLAQRVVDPDVPELERKKAKALIAVMDLVLMEAESVGEKLVNISIAILFGVSALLANAVRTWR